MPLMLPRRQQDTKDPDEERGVSEKNPWQEIEGTVRKVDEDKVKDCTEDVDALLVFAGLYSAVLTAFLIESYKNLAADETNTLLQQMVLQTANYRFTNGYLNSTFDPSLLPTFKAAVSDIRVNVCWFASLILSLSSASFGIAVKQWLREFLAIEYISPQERLRIRDARIQGLADWKLFQIAAFLPILLQISLLLFFVGLCFFTAAVHRSIGITSLFLVSCWAFFFLMSIIAPLFSPRCPYKTTLLKMPFRYARPHLRVCLAFVYGRLTTFFARLRRKTSTNPGDEASVTSTESTQESPRGFDYHDDYLDLGVLNKLYTSHVVEEKITVPEEEDKIRSADGQDLTIFSNIDIAFFDDSLLAKMPRALSLRPPPLRAILQSVITIVQGRIGPSLSKTPAESTRGREPWPWTLSQRARVALINILAESMVHDLHHVNRDWQDWARLESLESDWAASFVFLILLVSPYDAAPNSVACLFKTLGEYKWTGPLDVFSYQMRMWARSDPDWPARSLLFLIQSLDSRNTKKSEHCLRRVAHRGFVNWYGWGEEDTYRRLLERTTDDSGNNGVIAPTPQTIAALMEVARVFLHKYISEQTQDLDEFPKEISDLLEFVLDATPRVQDLPGVDFNRPLARTSDEPGLRRVLTRLFTTPQMIGQLLRFFATHTNLLSRSHSNDPLFFLRLIGVYSSLDDCIKILTACTEFFASQSTSAPHTSFTLDSPATLLRLCLVVWGYRSFDEKETAATWEKLCTAVYACYEHITQLNSDTSAVTCQYSDSYTQHTETCETAYTILQDCKYRAYKASNEMVKFFCKFVCANHTLDREGDKYRLIKRLEAAEAAAAEAAASEQPPGNFAEKLDTGVNVGEPAPADASPADVGPTHKNSTDGQLYAEGSAGPDEEGASRGPVVVGDALLGAIISLSPHSPAQCAAQSGSGVHDTGEHALRVLQPSTFEPTLDSTLQNQLDAETIDGVPESRSVIVRRSSLPVSLDSQEDSPPSARPAVVVADRVQIVDPPPISFAILHPDTDHGPVSTVDGNTPGSPMLAVPDFAYLLDDDGSLGGNVSQRRKEDGEAADAPVIRVVDITSKQDETAALPDGVGGEASVAGVAAFSEEGSGRLVVMETSELVLPVIPDVNLSSDEEFDTGGGAEVVATGSSGKVAEEG